MSNSQIANSPRSALAPQSGVGVEHYAGWLRALSDSELAGLLTCRPDLVAPLPADLSALAIRALSAPSIARAKDGLDRNQLDLLAAAAILDPGFSPADAKTKLNRSALDFDILISRGLLIERAGEIFLPDAVRASLGEFPLGLGPKSSIKLDLTALAEAPANSLELALKLSRHNPRGQSPDLRNPTPALKWLLDQNFLVPVDQDHALLMREVAIELRGYILPEPTPTPELHFKAVKTKTTDQAAIAAISNLLRWCEEIAHLWADESPQALKSGGLGLRDLRLLAAHLSVTEEEAAFLAELMFTAKLIVIDSDDSILPTQNFDLWLGKPVEERWRHLIQPWLETSRFAGAIGEAKAKESKAVAPLGPELDRPSLAFIKKVALNLIVAHAESAVDLASLTAYLRHQYPTRVNSASVNYLPWLLREFELLGLTGAGAPTTYAIALFKAEPLKLAAALPAPIDHILLQSDLTAVAPGPLLHELADQLGSVADLESRGAASIYRFNEASIRRALDHGMSVSEIRAFISKISKTPIPQPLDYLIQDVGKRHGQLRLGSATTYLRCEDAAVIQQILRDKQLRDIEFRELAPQVVISQTEPAEVLAALRNAGYLPMAESSAGVVVTAKLARRSKARPQPLMSLKELGTGSPATTSGLSQAIAALQAGERATSHAKLAKPKTSATDLTAQLAAAAVAGETISIGYADTNGGVSVRVVDPIQVAIGVLSAKDHATGKLEQFRISRITGMAPVESR